MITVDDIKACKEWSSMCFDGAGGSFQHVHQCQAYPRFAFVRRCAGRSQPCTLHYVIDGVDHPKLQTAVDPLNQPTKEA